MSATRIDFPPRNHNRIGLCLFALLGLVANPGTLARELSTNRVRLTPAYINSLSEELRTNHPALQAARAQAEAARSGVEGVRTWEDPMFTVGGMFAEEMMRADDGDLIYGIEQKLPLFGRPKLARAVAEAEWETEQARADYEFQSRRRDLAQALFRAALASQTVLVGSEDLAWLERMTQLAEQRYRTGEGTLVDFLRLQNEQEMRADRLRTDRRQLEHEHLVLNRLLNRDLTSPWPTFELPPVAGPVAYTPRLVELALRFEPGLRVRRQAIEQARSMARMVERERFPEIVLGARGRNYSGDGDFRSAEVMLGFTLPWGNAGKYRADRERAEALARTVEQAAADDMLELQEEIHLLTVRIDAARREALLYQEQIVPRSERALESSQAAWIANRGMFLDVMDARRMLLEARLLQARAQTEQYDQLSDLVLCCGLGDLEALEMLEAAPASPTP
ncbi:MAG: TolC family protein [Verrucomicrobia bacterium]|nr:TolC family protein [Verrucomicrobiota bacterium]